MFKHSICWCFGRLQLNLKSTLTKCIINIRINSSDWHYNSRSNYSFLSVENGLIFVFCRSQTEDLRVKLTIHSFLLSIELLCSISNESEYTDDLTFRSRVPLTEDKNTLIFNEERQTRRLWITVSVMVHFL